MPLSAEVINAILLGIGAILTALLTGAAGLIAAIFTALSSASKREVSALQKQMTAAEARCERQIQRLTEENRSLQNELDAYRGRPPRNPTPAGVLGT